MSNNWPISDKKWMAQRKQEWKYVAPKLKVLRDILWLNTEDFKYQKAYFFSGEIPKVDQADKKALKERLLGDYYRLPFLFKIWYAPEMTQEIAQEMFKEAEGSDLQWVYNVFFKYRGALTLKEPTSYGFVGANEKYLIRLLVPKKYDPDVHPYIEAKSFVLIFAVSIRWLTEIIDASRNHPSPTQFCLEYFESCFQHMLKTDISFDVEELRYFLENIAHFVEPNGRYSEDTSAKRVALKVYEILERTSSSSKKFSDYWQQIKERSLPLEPVRPRAVQKRRFVSPLISRVLLATDMKLSYIKCYFDVLQTIGISDVPYDMSLFSPVDVTELFSSTFKDELGYSDQERIPAYHAPIRLKEPFVDPRNKSRPYIFNLFVFKNKKIDGLNERPIAFIMPQVTADLYSFERSTECRRLELLVAKEFSAYPDSRLVKYSMDELPFREAGRKLRTEQRLLEFYKGFSPVAEGVDFFQESMTEITPWQGEPLPMLQELEAT